MDALYTFLDRSDESLIFKRIMFGYDKTFKLTDSDLEYMQNSIESDYVSDIYFDQKTKPFIPSEYPSKPLNGLVYSTIVFIPISDKSFDKFKIFIEINLHKLEDDWFYFHYEYKFSTQKETYLVCEGSYKCDQLDGLVSAINYIIKMDVNIKTGYRI